MEAFQIRVVAAIAAYSVDKPRSLWERDILHPVTHEKQRDHIRHGLPLTITLIEMGFCCETTIKEISVTANLNGLYQGQGQRKAGRAHPTVSCILSKR